MQGVLGGLSVPPDARPEGRPIEKSQIAQRRSVSPAVTQLPRGVSAKLIEETFETAAPRALSQLQIIRTAEARDGTKLAYSSMRRVIDRLVQEGKIEQVPGTKTWRYLPRQVTDGGDPGGDTPGSVDPMETMAAE
jgi:hypothetical protein